MYTLRSLFTFGRDALESKGIENAAQDAWLLLEYVCGISREVYLLNGQAPATPQQEERYKKLVEKRMAHMPLQYLTGEAYFYGLRFRVNEHVLVPRQDTECLVEETLSHMKDEGRILDLCTGSGCILLALLHRRPEYFGIGADISSEALAVAEKNGKDLGIKARFVKSNLFDRITGTYDIIVSNPPYIPTKEIEGLMEEVRDYEPRLALDGTEDGLYFYREIVRQSRDYLEPDGWLCLEIGWDQGEAVTDLLRKAGYKYVEVKQDLAGRDRVVTGQNR